MKFFKFFKRNKNKNNVTTCHDFDIHNPYYDIIKDVNLNKPMESYEYDDTVIFVPPIKKGKVIKVYDGDTITIATTLPYKKSPIYRFSVRVAGIDCPEMRTSNVNEKKCAVLAKQFTVDMVDGKIITLKNVKTEKYGRVLADVYCDDISLGDALLNARLAVKYDGKTKSTPINWLDYLHSK